MARLPALQLPASIAILLVLSPAFVPHLISVSVAGWGPVPIRETTQIIRPIESCPDGAGGAFVAWQEESSYQNGILKLQRVLPTGDIDPAWPSEGLLLDGAVANHRILGLVPDGFGGVFVVWAQSTAIRGLRVLASGSIAPGWASGGNLIGTGGHPAVASDGIHGIWVAWSAATTGTDARVPRAIRIGLSGTQIGSTAGPTDVHGQDPVTTLDTWLKVAPAADGGAYIGWESWSIDTASAPGALYLSRLDGDGTTSAGWPMGGFALEPFTYHLVHQYTEAPYMDISEDGRGGVFVITQRPVVFEYAPGYSETMLDVRLRRIQADGSSAVGWPADGRSIIAGQLLPQAYEDEGPDVMPDGSDGAFVGTSEYASEGYMATSYRRWTDSGPAGHFGTAYPLLGKSVRRSAAGGLFLGSFEADGPYSFWDSYAFLRVQQCPAPPGWSDFSEVHTEPVIFWYGDISITPASNGDAFFFWSQHNQIHGLFARRFGDGPLVSVPPPGAGALGLRAWFAPGEGVRVRGSIDRAGLAQVELYDVGGRRLAVNRIDPGSAFELTLPGTRGIDAGIYFVRLRSESIVRTVRFAVVR